MPSLGMKARDTMNKAGVHRKAAHGVKQSFLSWIYTNKTNWNCQSDGYPRLYKSGGSRSPWREPEQTHRDITNSTQSPPRFTLAAPFRRGAGAITAASPRRSALFTYNIGQNRNGFDAIGCPNRSSCFCRGGADRPCESANPAHSVVQMIQTAVILKCHPDGAELQFPFGLNEGTR